MDEARQVLERLSRIEELEREGASSDVLLGELRQLVREAEAWVRVEPDSHEGRGAVERCRSALAAIESREVLLLAR